MLNADAVAAHLAALGRGLRPGALGAEVRTLGSVTSTNDIAWAWADAGCPEGLVILAEEQVRGRGRFGRSWDCPRGRGLLMSVVLRPPAEAVGAAHVTALGALAVAEAVEELAQLSARIRWPNDVTVRDRKLAGVLVETRGGEGAPPCVMGMGVNVNVRPEELADEVRSRAASLASEAGREFEIEEVAARVLGRLDARYREALEGRWPDVAAAWRARNSLLGEQVRLESRGRAYRGRVVGLDPVAGIELEFGRGERRAFRAEWTTLVEPPAGERLEEASGPLS